MRIYAACLASYNNGVLHGRWIDASSDVDEMQEEVNAMLRESRFPNVTVDCPECDGTGLIWNGDRSAEYVCPNCREGRVPSAEEFAIHDFEGLPRSLGEHSGLRAVAAVVALVEDTDFLDQDVVIAVVDDCDGDVAAARDMLEYRFCGVYDSFRDYADEAADDMLSTYEIPDDHPAVRYFDYAAWARDLSCEMHVVPCEGGVAVFHA